MYYHVQRGVQHDLTERIGKIILVVLGLIIGVSLGLYVAAKTLPLPTVTNNNFYRTP